MSRDHGPTEGSELATIADGLGQRNPKSVCRRSQQDIGKFRPVSDHGNLDAVKEVRHLEQDSRPRHRSVDTLGARESACAHPVLEP